MKKHPFDHILVPWVNPGVNACIMHVFIKHIRNPCTIPINKRHYFIQICGSSHTCLSWETKLHVILSEIFNLHALVGRIWLNTVFCSLFLETRSLLIVRWNRNLKAWQEAKRNIVTLGQWPHGKRIYEQKWKLGIIIVKISNFRLASEKKVLVGSRI